MFGTKLIISVHAFNNKQLSPTHQRAATGVLWKECTKKQVISLPAFSWYIIVVVLIRKVKTTTLHFLSHISASEKLKISTGYKSVISFAEAADV